ncbi:MAG: carboxymuconolactone decarboxylase family protein [Dehalococcoidia bacterium]|nr:carboxymuconolactone decarboxylase family protein [Dehalococcoidia bacterium]
MTAQPDPSLARGMQVASQMFPPGAPAAAPRFEYPDEIAADWSAFSVSTVLGDVWGRPGLDLKQRALISIATLTALSRLGQLRAYIVAGLNLGLTRSEICEAIFQVSVYAGFPAAIEGLGVANSVFREADAATKKD